MSLVTRVWHGDAAALPGHLSSGDPLFDGQAYELLSLLGRGGMACVYLAHQRATGRRVAIKFVESTGLNKGLLQRRLVREAHAVAAIRHPNVVEFIETGLFGSGSMFIAMEYLEGCTLRKRIDDRGSLGATEVAAIGAMIAHGVAAAHAAGIVHRDLKPSNIMLVPGQATAIAKVFDFGIAKQAIGLRSLTVPGTAIGTPQYMSPEQRRGAVDVDHRSDIYSLGVMLYRALAGRRPSPTEHERRRELTSVSTGAVDPATAAIIADLIAGCLAEEPDQRPQSMSEIAAVLESTAEPSPSSQRPTSLSLTSPWLLLSPAPTRVLARLSSLDASTSPLLHGGATDLAGTDQVLRRPPAATLRGEVAEAPSNEGSVEPIHTAAAAPIGPSLAPSPPRPASSLPSLTTHPSQRSWRAPLAGAVMLGVALTMWLWPRQAERAAMESSPATTAVVAPVAPVGLAAVGNVAPAADEVIIFETGSSTAPEFASGADRGVGGAPHRSIAERDIAIAPEHPRSVRRRTQRDRKIDERLVRDATQGRGSQDVALTSTRPSPSSSPSRPEDGDEHPVRLLPPRQGRASALPLSRTPPSKDGHDFERIVF